MYPAGLKRVRGTDGSDNTNSGGSVSASQGQLRPSAARGPFTSTIVDDFFGARSIRRIYTTRLSEPYSCKFKFRIKGSKDMAQ